MTNQANLLYAKDDDSERLRRLVMLASALDNCDMRFGQLVDAAVIGIDSEFYCDPPSDNVLLSKLCWFVALRFGDSVFDISDFRVCKTRQRLVDELFQLATKQSRSLSDIIASAGRRLKSRPFGNLYDITDEEFIGLTQELE